ncbi:OmpH family outer membrane protein [Pelosinus propionicus]|uniref:Outer membrane protein n=1 Tax=Pelosinus propionicus DSM 13327 TaxID=1123291 RepID=A0A1I4MCI5_9FIRM|nr:OmpH family outer membrane protein [Pelosinus propionicus]SFM00918.1 outer membrane protein [Pelosinus propionicus DSM 13327]
MQPSRNKRIVPVLLALCLLLGAWGTAQAAPAAGPVGYLDFIALINQHPDTAAANAALKAEQEAAKQEFDSKAAGLNEVDRQNLARQLDLRVEQKRQELLRPIAAKVTAAANEVAKAKGLSIVIGKQDVVCGGVDITADVLKIITVK